MSSVVNYYQELGLRPDATLPEVREELRDLKLRSASKAGRPGSEQQMWARLFELCGQAEIDFADEDSRERYDLRLRRERVAESAQIDWTARAWSYYYLHDYGAAAIAARKAKEQSPESPMSYVVSAWIHLSQGENEQALRDADEAFVLDESSADVVDVQEVRGEVYRCLGNYDRAIVCFDRALDEAARGERPELYWRKALALASAGHYERANETAILGLSQGVELQEEMSDRLEEVLVQSIASAEGNTSDSDAVRLLGARIDVISGSEMGTESKRRVVASVEGLIVQSLGRWAYSLGVSKNDSNHVIESLRALASEAAALLSPDRRAAVLGYIETLVQHQELQASSLHKIATTEHEPISKPPEPNSDVDVLSMMAVPVLALLSAIAFIINPIFALLPGLPAIVAYILYSRNRRHYFAYEAWKERSRLREMELSELRRRLDTLAYNVPKPSSYGL